MTAHNNAEMVKAKADNMDLVVFYKLEGEEWWQKESNKETFPLDPDIKYFLCLPKHNESGQCLHWLNGGSIIINDNPWSDSCMSGHNHLGHPFFLCERTSIKVKSRKEKRWIRINKNNERVDHRLYKTEADCKYSSSDKCWSHYQIEVEV